jgi:transposase
LAILIFAFALGRETGMDATTRFSTERVGALPIIAEYLEKLRLREIVDEFVPWEGEVPLGTLVEVMICNRMLNVKAQYKIGEWAEGSRVCEYYGVSQEELNDDRLGRGLERIARHAFTVQSQLVLHVIKTFKLDVGKIHYDISNVELYGAYERQLNENGEAKAGPTPEYGRTKSGRKNVKQVQFGVNVARDGAVPLDLLPFDGSQAEVKTHLENLNRLRQMLPTTNRVYTADTKFDSPENLLQNKAHGGKFLCGGVFQPHLKEEYLRIKDQMRLVDYCPKSKQHLPPEKRPKYKVYEVWKTLSGDVDGRRVCLRYRLVFVWSEAKANEEAKTRDRHLKTIREEFEKIERNLNKYSLKTREKIVERLESAKNKHSIGHVIRYELISRKGQFKLRWHIDQTALGREQQLEGAYLLKTDLPKGVVPAAKVLAQYKDQIHVERRIGDMKGPLAIAPMFLEKPERIAGLMQILLWALMLLSLMERDVRRSLDGEPMYGIYPENRPCFAPTGRGILECFEELSIVVVKHKGETWRRLAELTSVQRQLLGMMGIPPDSLSAFKRKCCQA